MSRPATVVLVVAAVAVGSTVAWRVWGGGKGALANPYVTATVERGSIVGRVTATGTVSALVTVQVGTQVSGRVASLGADFNASVKKGQVLATLDPRLFEAALASARANELAAAGNLAKARAQSVDAQRTLRRQEQLLEQRLIAQADYDSAQAAAAVAQASIMSAEGSVAQARAARQQAEVNLGYTTIVSPIDGTVVSRAVDIGQTVAASLQAPTIFTIAENLSTMQVDTNVAEADVGKLREGLEATFTVDAFPQRAFTGRIRQIRFAPQVVSNVVTYDAVIDVDNPELLLRPGMTANVTFVYARADDVLRVPNAALRFKIDAAAAGATGPGGRPDGGRPDGPRPDGGPRRDARGAEMAMKRVWVLQGETPQPRRLEVGLSDGSFSEVKGGELHEGDVVIVDKQGGDGAGPSGQPRSQGMGGMRRMF